MSVGVCVCVCACVRVYVCECVRGCQRASYEHGAAAFFPSENVQANPNRPALNVTAPHPGLRIDKLNHIQNSSQRNHCSDYTCKGRDKLKK